MQTMPTMRDAPLCPFCKGPLEISVTRDKEDIADINSRADMSPHTPNPDIIVLLGCARCRKAIVIALELSETQSTYPPLPPKKGGTEWGKPLIHFVP